MDEIDVRDNSDEDIASSYQSIQRRYNQHRRNIQILEERKAKLGINVPIEVLNELAYEKQQIAPLRDLLSDPTLGVIDELDTNEQNGLILARLRRVEQRQQNREAQAEEDYKQRRQRQREIDARDIERDRLDAERDRQIGTLVTQLGTMVQQQTGQTAITQRQLIVQVVIAVVLVILFVAFLIGMSIFFARG